MKTMWLLALGCTLLVTFSTPAAAGIRVEATLANPVVLAHGKTRTYLKVALRGGDGTPPGRRPGVNVALVIDCSGSMRGEKLVKAREAATMAVGRLGERDIVSAVTYSETVRVAVPATRLTDRDHVLQRLDTLTAGGGTALFAGVSKGAAEVRKFGRRDRVNRVILLSDGLANVGPSSPGALGELGRSFGREGISVTTIGLGNGYNEDLMVNLAQAGDGNHAFARTADDLIAIFDREFSDVLSVVAQDVGIRIRCRPNVEPIRVLGRDADVRGGDIRIGLNQLYSAQEKYAVVELDVVGSGAEESLGVAGVDVSYFDAVTRTQESQSISVTTRTSPSREQVEQSVNREAMVSAVTQIANDVNIRAMELKDAGQADEARQVLEENATYIQEANKRLDSQLLERLQKWNLDDARAVYGNEWEARGRKAMRERQYQLKNQQAVPESD